MKKSLPAIVLVATSLLIPRLTENPLLTALWPALVALAVILLTRLAALGLAAGLISGVLILHHQQPILALRAIFSDHLFPAIDGPWRVGAIIFTLILGAFAGLLEKSGGFNTILKRLLAKAKDPQKRLLGSVYLIGLICFFDGLANSILTGRIARPLADRTGVSRERLAWVVDSTSSPIACVAFISTWIATQLSLIQQGLENAPFPVEPYTLFFQSIPANPYCLLTLILVPLAIALSYQPRAMRRYPAHPPVPDDPETQTNTSPKTALIPLLSLILGIFAAFPLLSNPIGNPLSIEGWKNSFSSDAGPYALVAGSLFGLAIAWLFFPKKSKTSPSTAAFDGATNLLPALVILILAWALGGVFSSLGAGDELAKILSSSFPISWLPLSVFVAGAFISFATGSSWGTMGLLMPLALPATLAAANHLPADQLLNLIPAIIGAVFGGAVFGDHCSPFSDTTIVSSIASGCEPTAHIHSQLPFAAITAFFAAISYTFIALGLSALIATLLSAILLTITIYLLSKKVTTRPVI